MTRGIVLTRRPEDGYPYPMILIFENGFRNVRDFKLIPLMSTKVNNKKAGSNKFPERTYAYVQTEEMDTLMFGQMIEWDDHDGGVELVREFSRVQHIYESRIWDGETQLLLQGVMSKNRKVLWMLDLWPDLEIPYNLQQNSHPNVVADVWVTVQIRPNQSLKYELHSFEKPSERFQQILKKAKWNSADDENVGVLLDPVAGDRLNSEYAPVLSSSINAMRGIVASKKCVLAEEDKHRDVCFHRIVINDNDRFPPIDKVDFLNIYALKDVVNIAENQRASVTERGHLKATIRYCEDLPGFYHSKFFGIYLDDPDNVLEGWLLSEYTRSTLQVGITAAEPSERGTARYAITEIVDAKAKKVADLRQSGSLKLNDELAVVIEDYGDLYVPKLPKSTIRLSREDARKYPPGTVLRISGVLEKKIAVKSVKVDGKLEPFQAVTTYDEITEQEQVLFSVPELRGCKELPSLLFSPVFGFVEAPKSFRILKNPERSIFKNVWITLNDCYPGDSLLPPARFKVFSFDEPNVEVEQIAPYEVESSPLPESETSVAPEDRREFALNNARIPIVNTALGDEEVETKLEAQGVSVIKMMQELEKRDDWKKDPTKAIEQEIQNHMHQCKSCTEKKLGDSCYFAEFLALALQSKHEIIKALSNKDLITPIVLRRFQ